MKVKVIKKILENNEKIAEENKRYFENKGIFVINLMGSPGAGKTSLLMKSIYLLKEEINIGVIEGDITGSEDGKQIKTLGIPVVQINTLGACHLDANMIKEVLKDIPTEEIKLLFIENVGNLVCPAEFYLGENMKVMIFGITEGDDKALKYPLMFQNVDVLLLNKIDLFPYIDIDINKIKDTAQKLNPSLKIFEISCKTEKGINKWIEFLKKSLIN